MDKSPVTFKRRRSGRALSELPWNASDVNVDPESAVSLLASEDEGIGDVTPSKENVPLEKRSRKRWSDDQPLPRKRTRSSTAVEKDFNPKDIASELSGTIIGNKGKDKGKGIVRSHTPRKQAKDFERSTPNKQVKDIEGTTPRKQAKEFDRTTPRKLVKDFEGITPRKQAKDFEKITPRKQVKDIEGTTPRKPATEAAKTTPGKHASKKSPGGGKLVSLQSPIEFVKEKQAMFAEIDAFELESEEEEPDEGKGKLTKLEIESSESSKGETTGQSSGAMPEQSTQEVPSTEEVEEKENG